MVFSKYRPVDKTQVYDWITELYEYLRGYSNGLITQFPVQKGAPTLAAKDENQILTKIIAELENVFLTTEQKHVLEQLKNLIGQQLLPSHTTLLQNYPNISSGVVYFRNLRTGSELLIQIPSDLSSYGISSIILDSGAVK